MPSILRQVLNAFETADQPRTLKQLARELDISPGMLEGMIEHWVRRGKLRPLHTSMACGACSSAPQCPFIMQMPPTYELVTDDSPPPCEENVCQYCS